METPVNYFEALYKIPVTDHIEKKNGFSYVSWPFAVAELRKRHPEATWRVVRFDGLPYLATPNGVFVEVEVTVLGITLSQIHPVLNHSNKPIEKPTAFDINTSLQRCLVKAIALHGLGLHVYAGEDVPRSETDEMIDRIKGANVTGAAVAGDAFSELPEEAQAVVREWAMETIALVNEGKVKEAAFFLAEKCQTTEDKLAVWSQLPSNVRTKLKAKPAMAEQA